MVRTVAIQLHAETAVHKYDSFFRKTNDSYTTTDDDDSFSPSERLSQGMICCCRGLFQPSCPPACLPACLVPCLLRILRNETSSIMCMFVYFASLSI